MSCDVVEPEAERVVTCMTKYIYRCAQVRQGFADTDKRYEPVRAELEISKLFGIFLLCPIRDLRSLDLGSSVVI